MICYLLTPHRRVPHAEGIVAEENSAYVASLPSYHALGYPQGFREARPQGSARQPRGYDQTPGGASDPCSVQGGLQEAPQQRAGAEVDPVCCRHVLGGDDYPQSPRRNGCGMGPNAQGARQGQAVAPSAGKLASLPQ